MSTSEDPVVDMDVLNATPDLDEEEEMLQNDDSPIKSKSSSKPLDKCRVFIDVGGSENVDLAKTLQKKIKKLGGTGLLNRKGEITHIIFENDQSKLDSNKSKYPDAAIVNPQWLTQVEKQGIKVDTSKFEPKVVSSTGKKNMKPTKHKSPKNNKRKRGSDDEEEDEKPTKKKKASKDEDEDKDEDGDVNMKPRKKKKGFTAPRPLDSKSSETKGKESKKKVEKKSDKKSKEKKSSKTEKKSPKKETKKKTPTKKKSPAKKKSPRQKKEKEEFSDDEPLTDEDVHAMTDDVDLTKVIHVRHSKSPRKAAKYCIEFSGFDANSKDVEKFTQAIDSGRGKKVTGGITITSEDTPYNGEKFTHLVLAGNSKRTLKTMFAIAFGAKIVSIDWMKEFTKLLIDDSEEKVDAPNEDEYLVEPWASKALERLKYITPQTKVESDDETEEPRQKNLFEGSSFSFHGFDNLFEQHNLERLVKLFGASVTTSHRRASYTIIKKNPNDSVRSAKISLNLKWLADSICDLECHDVESEAYKFDTSKIQDRTKKSKKTQKKGKETKKKEEEEKDNEDETTE